MSLATLANLQVVVESGPGAQFREKSVSGALGVDILTMSNDVILVVQAQAIHSAEEQVTESLQRGLARLLVRVRAQEADAQGLLVESGGVQARVVKATALVDGSVVSDAEVVGDVCPTEHVRVQALEVTHLGGAGLERIAVVAGRVMDYYPRSGLVGQGSVGSVGASPSALSVNLRAHCDAQLHRKGKN